MEKSIKVFSVILIKLFNLISKSSCHTFLGEPDFPEELLK